MATFTIASWNVHMGLHNDSAGARDTTNEGPLNDVVARCVEIDADVLVLQEACWWRPLDGEISGTSPGSAGGTHMIDAVAQAIGGEAHRFVGDVPHRYPVPWTIAVISRLPSRRLDDLVLPSLPHRDRAMIRVQLVDHELIVGGGHHDGVHSLRTRPGLWWRQQQVMRAAAHDNDIIAGDMNMWGPVVAQNAPGMRRAVTGRTWPAWRAHSQIDHILVNDRVQVVQSSVLGDMGSDHRAVKATLRI